MHRCHFLSIQDLGRMVAAYGVEAAARRDLAQTVQAAIDRCHW